MKNSLAYVDIIKLGKKYSEQFSLKEVSFSVEKGETLTLMGPSGSGKTSVLRNIAGLDIPDAGSVIISGKNITKMPVRKRNVGIIFQDLALFPHMTVYDNISYGLRVKGFKRGEIEHRVYELAKMLGIHNLLERYPGEISGGEKQRVALARSVAPAPLLLLLDEPLSSLDTHLRNRVRSDIKEFAHRIGLTMIYVTHDHSEGLFMADKASLIFNGRVKAPELPETLFNNPKDVETCRFFGYNVIHIAGETVAFHPLDISIDDEEPDFFGAVTSKGFEGEHTRVHLKIANTGESVELKFNRGMGSENIRVGDLLSIKILRKHYL